MLPFLQPKRAASLIMAKRGKRVLYKTEEEQNDHSEFKMPHKSIQEISKALVGKSKKKPTRKDKED